MLRSRPVTYRFIPKKERLGSGEAAAFVGADDVAICGTKDRSTTRQSTKRNRAMKVFLLKSGLNSNRMVGKGQFTAIIGKRRRGSQTCPGRADID